MWFKTFLKSLGIESGRSLNITKHVIISFLYKGGSVLSSFLIVPLSIKYLDTENYGIWLTISSFIAWFSFFDIGLGNGLRNKFVEAKASGDLKRVKGYVSSAYYSIGTLILVLIFIFVLINFYVDWTNVFNVKSNLQNDLVQLMPIVFSCFCLQLVLKLIITIYTADLQHSVPGKFVFYSNVASLAIIWSISQKWEGSLLSFGITYSLIPVIILFAFNYIGFSGPYEQYKPEIKYWKREFVKDIFGLGTLFLIIQISGIILYSTDNYLIAYFFSPSDVVPYNIAYKYFGVSIMLFSIIATPYWTSVSDAFNKQDYSWLILAMKQLKNISLLFILLVFILFVFAQFFYGFWIGDKVSVPLSLNILMALFFVSSIYVMPFTMFLNGTGKIKVQAIQSVVVALINVPLAIVLSKFLFLGVNGVILATVICFIPSIVLSKVQYKMIIQKTAQGVWNK